VAKRLVDAGLIHGDAITVTGSTIAEAAQMTKETAGQEVVRPVSNPLKTTGGLVILKGNLAPEGCVVKSRWARKNDSPWAGAGVRSGRRRV